MILARAEEGRAARFVPGQPALVSGRGAYHKTWDIEGSLARRGIRPRSTAEPRSAGLRQARGSTGVASPDQRA